jgi:hypothetical protein
MFTREQYMDEVQRLADIIIADKGTGAGLVGYLAHETPYTMSDRALVAVSCSPRWRTGNGRTIGAGNVTTIAAWYMAHDIMDIVDAARGKSSERMRRESWISPFE